MRKWTATCKRIRLDHFLTQKRKCICPETIKLLEGNTSHKLFDIGNDNDVFGQGTKAKAMNSIDKHVMHYKCIAYPQTGSKSSRANVKPQTIQKYARSYKEFLKYAL